MSTTGDCQILKEVSDNYDSGTAVNSHLVEYVKKVGIIKAAQE